MGERGAVPVISAELRDVAGYKPEGGSSLTPSDQARDILEEK